MAKESLLPESYVGTKKASEISGLSQATIARRCREGRVPGAVQDAPRSPWHIPLSSLQFL